MTFTILQCPFRTEVRLSC